MPLTRKRQILAKIETSEGQNANPDATNAVLVYEPDVKDDVQTSDRVPAGASLSRDFVPIGRKTRTVNFQSDFRGSADITIPITVPDWGGFLNASGFKFVQPVKIPVTSVSGALGFQVGEIVQKSSTIRGIVLGCFSGGTTLTKRLTGNGDIVVCPIQGTFTTGGTLTGESSGTTATIGTIANYEGLAYVPTSEKLHNCTAASWAPGNPSVGNVALIKASGVVVGSCQIVADNSGGGWTDFDVVMLHGTIASGNVLTAGANSATLSATPTMKRTPSMTLRTNLDGRQKDAVGSRGDFECSGEAGGPLIFKWTFTGDPVASSDAMPVATSGLSSIRPPRLLGSIITVGRTVYTLAPTSDTATDFFTLPTKSIGFQSGNSINPNLDCNSPGGSTGSNVADRDPQITAQMDEVHSAFDWESFRDNSLAIRFAAILGATKGQIVGFCAPNCQVLEANPGDADRVAVDDVNLRPRRVLEGGDDEVVFFQL